MPTWLPNIEYYLSYKNIRESVDKYIMDNFVVEDGKIVKKEKEKKEI